MKKVIAFLLAVLPITLYAQTEFTTSLGSGLFFFRGNSAVKNSFLNINNESKSSYINNPYGANPGISFNISEGINHSTKSGFLFGISLGFNYLRSVIYLEQAYEKGQNVEINKSNGVFKIYDMSFTPAMGKRLKINNLDIDINAGAEIAFPVYAEDKANIITKAGYEIEVNRKRSLLKTDIRPTLKLNTYYNNFGIFASYSHGLSNYTAGMNGANMEVYSRLIRFGVNYRFQKS